MARRGAVEPPKEEENTLSFMQPEILPIQIMIDVLKERGMKSVSLQDAERRHIIRLFHKHVCPKHQRDYRENRRGKIMMLMRRKRERGNNEENWKKMVMDSKERTLPSNPSDTSAERLKPPPSCINTERKTIKLGSTNTGCGSKLDNIVVKRKGSDDINQESENKSKKLSSDGEINNEQKKRKDEEDHLISKKSRQNSDEHQDELQNGKNMKNDRKPITWP